MARFSIIGSGHHLPGSPVDNHALARVMDTNDEWIRQRTGIAQRYFAAPGEGAASLAAHASRQALADAGIQAEDLDYILFNTMTPDHVFPGSGTLLGAELGCHGVPALDLRTQCAAFVYSLQVADALISSGAARTLLIVGAEAHAGFMPWSDWDVLRGESDRRPRSEDWTRASQHRGWAIIFGDGAGAVVVRANEESDAGLLGVDVHADGRYADQLFIEAGFRQQPYVTATDLNEGRHLPRMAGRDVFKHAVTKLPRSVKRACERARVKLEDIDWFIAHQANTRINEAVCAKLGAPPEKFPSNIETCGNTSSATIPILMDQMRRDGRLRTGQLACVVALGAGLHWGSLILRV